MNENIRILKPFFRGLPIIIFCVILAILGAKKYLNYVTPMYESTAKLKLADLHEGVPNANLFKDFDIFATSNKIATEIEVLKSKKLIENALSKLSFSIEIYRKGLYRSSEVYLDSPISIKPLLLIPKAYDKLYRIKVKSMKSYTLFYPDSEKGIEGQFGKILNIKWGKILIDINNLVIKNNNIDELLGEYEFECLSEEKLLSKINKNIDIVSVDKDVPVIRINYKSTVPEKAAEFVNALAKSYIEDYIQVKFRAANVTVEFLKNEIEGANKRLVNAEQNIQDFRDKKNIKNIHQETETDLRKISQLKTQQINLKMSLDAIRDLNKYIERGKDNYLDLAVNFEAFTDLLSTEMVKNIKRLQSEKKDLLLTYTPENEKVKIIDDKLKDLIDYQIESIKNTEKNLQIKYDDLSNDIIESEKVFIGLPEREKILATLNREFNLYEKNYNFLNEKRIEAEIARSAKIAFHKIISPAEVEKTPISPIRAIIIILAAFLGFFGSVILIYVVHYLKAKVNDIHTIEKNSNIPVAIATPFLRDKKQIEKIFLKDAIQLELKKIIENKTILTITSYDESKDHLFHTLNFYKAFTTQAKKVFVVDATGELQNFVGKENYLNVSDISYLRYPKSYFEEELNNKLKDFDICLIHNQSVKENKLALLFMSITHQNLMVLDSRKTAEKTIIVIELLREEFKLPNFWFILNKTDYLPSIWYELRKGYHKLKNKIRLFIWIKLLHKNQL